MSLEDIETCVRVLERMHNDVSFRRSPECQQALQLCLRISKDKSLYKDKKQRLKERDFEAAERTLIRQARKMSLIGQVGGSMEMESPPIMNLTEFEAFCEQVSSINDDPVELNYKRNCHICRAQFRQLHFFYDQLCSECAAFNYTKRSMYTDLTGKVAIVTGARVKIGYCIALRLLRMGCTVICTTRFPKDCFSRYSQEQDFTQFSSRIFIYGVDFRNISMVHQFCDNIKHKFDRLDILINNAAQTVRKPPKFYEHLIAKESVPLLEDNGHVYSQALAKTEFGSAELSQVRLIPSDDVELDLFPQDQLDRDGQQIDLRRENSWNQVLGQVSTVEMIECHVINTFAPWILVTELKPLMKSDQNYIVNVSAMEGQFYRAKSRHHPHTNMAKAALNMLTRTSAVGLQAENIYMTCVDTGWITDENPRERWEKRKNNPPPLDEVDGAMRVLDPVISGYSGQEKHWGVFLKNYTLTRW
ncbi:short-chain dehydrogenase [Gorgonomyces haynaldii]|nr:short-chain dehydrogenase [Gorgonomyces haynaldii]